MIRAVETVDPRSLFGRPWCDLTYGEQVELIAYAMLRNREEVPVADE